MSTVELSVSNPDELYVRANPEVAHEAANWVHDDVDRLLDLRDKHSELSEKDPEGTFMILPKELKKELGLSRTSLYYEPDHVPTTITNAQALSAIEFELEKVVDKVNDTVNEVEVEAEHKKYNEMVDEGLGWTNETTRYIANRPLSYWRRLSPEAKSSYMCAYAREHPTVLGLRSSVILHYTGYIASYENPTPNSDMITLSDFVPSIQQQP